MLQLRERQRWRRAIARSQLRDSIFEIDPFLQVRPRPNPSLHVNEHGFRGDPIEPDLDVFRIFVFGGSSFFEWRLQYADTFAARLQRRLRARHPGVPIQVQDASCDWYSSAHSLVRYVLDVRRYRPQMVLLGHGHNDLQRSFAPPWYTLPGARFRPDYAHYLGPFVRREWDVTLAPFPFRRLLLPRLLLGRVRDAGIPGEDAPDFLARVLARQQPVPVESFPSIVPFRENLEKFVQIARADDTAPVLIITATLISGNLTDEMRAKTHFAPVCCSTGDTYPDETSMRRALRDVARTVAEVGRATNTPVVDFDRMVPKDLDHFRDDSHVTPRATELEADAMLAAIEATSRIERWQSRQRKRAATKDGQRKSTGTPSAPALAAQSSSTIT